MPAIGAIAGVGSALIGASSAKKAANAQSKAADQQYQLQERIYEDTKGRFEPYEQAGGNALAAYMYEMGLGPKPTIGGSAPTIETIATPGSSTGGGDPNQIKKLQMQMWATGNRDTRDDLQARIDQLKGTSSPGSTLYRVGGNDFGTMEEAQKWASANPTGGSSYAGFTATPGYQFRVDQGNDSINALAGAQGGLLSGKTLQNLATFNQNIASDEYGSYMGRLSGLVDMGQTSAANTGSASNAFANGASNALGAKGNAQSAGAIGVGNALQGGINNGMSIWGYQQGLQQQQPQTGPINSSGWRP